MRNKEIPKGLRDLLPDEMKTRRKLEKKAAELFALFGYEEVLTPTFEFLEVVEAGGNMREKLFLFMDREGGILSLRPEMTVAIARLAATHLQDEKLPRRLYYSTNVFRHVQPHLAQYREFWQTGVELLGASGPWADAEVISLAVKVMLEFGVNNFIVSLNQIGIFNSLLEDSAIEAEEKDIIKKLVEKKDLVELSRTLEKLPIRDLLKETIAMLPTMHGGLEILNKLPCLEKSRNTVQAVEELIQIYDALQCMGVQEHILVDMGVIRGLDYYTGVVFEGFSPDLGYGLLGGGRYDRLLSQFGFPCPATGFALGMDRLTLVLKSQHKEPPRYLVGGANLQAVLRKADALRLEGKIVELDVERLSREELQKKLAGRGHYTLVYVDGE
ncbi:MAG: ATP phosphoribosyltransferase regulatory subunit [Syntrophomonadaceae bacterium]|nr:ATP phosphoribosyltransferase regulatory subunit [Syntrophomonadaceae bacterium]